MCLHHHLYKHPILRTKWWYFFSIITFLRNLKQKILLFWKLYCFAHWREAKVTPKWNCVRSWGSFRHISSTTLGVLHFQGTIGFQKDTIGFQKAKLRSFKSYFDKKRSFYLNDMHILNIKSSRCHICMGNRNCKQNHNAESPIKLKNIKFRYKRYGTHNQIK